AEFKATPQSPINHPDYQQAMDDFQLNITLEYVIGLIAKADQQIDTTKPWTLSGDELKSILDDLVNQIATIAILLDPFLPTTSAKILAQFPATHITASDPLFPRLS